MVEELARWKASLSHKVNEANETLRKFLDEGKQIRENVVKTHENLCKLRDNFDLHNKKNKRNFSNILELCEENFKISDTLMIELLGSKVASCKEEICLNHWKKTPAEKSAEHVSSKNF